MKILAVMTEPEAVHRILKHLRMPPDPTRPARARDPTYDFEWAGADQSTWDVPRPEGPARLERAQIDRLFQRGRT
jgi:hypothetical protein